MNREAALEQVIREMRRTLKKMIVYRGTSPKGEPRFLYRVVRKDVESAVPMPPYVFRAVRRTLKLADRILQDGGNDSLES